MRWSVFAVLAWVFLGVELGLRDALRLGPTLVAPSFLFTLAAFVALSAPPIATLWTCLALGLLTDLTWSVELRTGGTATIVGPYALGYLLAGQLIVSMRALMIRWNPLTLGFLAGVGSCVAQITVVGLCTLRAAFGAPIVWTASEQLAQRLGASVYTGVVAVLVGFVLMPLAPVLGLPTPQQRRFGRR
jgi:hypothetical protein